MSLSFTFLKMGKKELSSLEAVLYIKIHFPLKESLLLSNWKLSECHYYVLGTYLDFKRQVK